MIEHESSEMKVLFVFGGLPHYYNKILNKLNSQDGIEISVLVPTGEDSKALGKGVYQTMDGIKFNVHRLPEYKTWIGKPFFRGFKSFFLEQKYDVVVLGWPYILPLAFNFGVRRLFKKLNVKVICKEIPFQVPRFDIARKFFWNYDDLTENLEISKQNRWIKRFKYLILTYARKVYYNFADAHVDYTEEATEIISSYGVDKEKIFIIYNSPDTEELLEAGKRIKNKPKLLPENHFRLIHVGRLVKWKRVDLLISAVQRLEAKYPSIELVVIGTGPDKAELEEQAKSLAISNRVNFIGGVYDNETLGQYLSESAIYVLGGMGGLSINDAMCFGKPIICSVCDGTEKKLVRNNLNGFIFENGSLDDLTSKIDRILSDPLLLKKMGEMSSSIIEKEINTNIVISNYLRAFEYVSKKK